jgi:DNA-binding transcriptional regulator YiaG
MGIHALPFSVLRHSINKPKGYGYPRNPKTIGEQIKKKRMDMGLYQKDISKILNVSEDTITGWENGRSSPQKRYIEKIYHFLEKSF